MALVIAFVNHQKAVNIGYKITGIAESSGLTNVSTTVKNRKLDGHRIYSAELSCDNFRALSYEDMFNLERSIQNLSNRYILTKYYSENNVYDVYTYPGKIQKNGKLLYEKKQTSNSSSDSTTSSTLGNETDAKICAEKLVRDNLKSPSTAKFCKYTEMTATDLGANKWMITGYVDAENSFGATKRETWVVTLTLTETGFKDYSISFN